MKILLNALPRAKSKWVCFNINEYLKAKYDFSSDLLIGKCRLPLTDWFTKKDEGLSFSGHIIKCYQDFLYISTNVKANDEIQNRLDLLLDCHNPMSIKIHPTSWHELIAIQVISCICDRYYTVRRRNILEQCISILTCEHTNAWNPGSTLDSQISKCLDNPFIVDTTAFIKKLDFLKMQNDYLNQQTTAIHLYAEDMINITDAKDFCSYLQLPYVEFEIHNGFNIEYGEKKSSMIKNYDQLMEIANAYFKNSNPARFL